MSTNLDSDKLRDFLHTKLAQKKKANVHPEHSARFDRDMQFS